MPNFLQSFHLKGKCTKSATSLLKVAQLNRSSLINYFSLLFPTICDISTSEQIYIQKCRLQARQDALIPKMWKLMQKFSTILEDMEFLESNMSKCNWFEVKEVLETLDRQLEMIETALVTCELLWFPTS